MSFTCHIRHITAAVTIPVLIWSVSPLLYSKTHKTHKNTLCQSWDALESPKMTKNSMSPRRGVILDIWIYCIATFLGGFFLCEIVTTVSEVILKIEFTLVFTNNWKSEFFRQCPQYDVTYVMFTLLVLGAVWLYRKINCLMPFDSRRIDWSNHVNPFSSQRKLKVVWFFEYFLLVLAIRM